MCTIKFFQRWYNNKDVVPTPKAMQKLLAFYHKKRNDIVNIGCTLSNLANSCLHKSTGAVFIHSLNPKKTCCKKIREDMVGGPSIVSSRTDVVNETFIRNSGNFCKSIVGIDASQLCPYSLCQPRPTSLYTRWEYDTKSFRFKPQENKSRNFENMLMSCF